MLGDFQMGSKGIGALTLDIINILRRGGEGNKLGWNIPTPILLMESQDDCPNSLGVK